MRFLPASFSGHDRVRAIVAGLVLLTIAFWSGPAAAHTDFVSSSPSDQAVVSGEVAEVVLVFSGDAKPAGEGFVVLDPSGAVRQPDTVISPDNRTFVLGFIQPLAGGEVGVRWMVQAADAHPIEGTFRFTVEAPPASTSSDKPQAETMTTQPSAEKVESSPTPSPVLSDPLDQPSLRASSTSIDEFFAEAPNPVGATSVGVLGRVLSLLGAMIGVGGLVFLLFVLRGSPSEIRSVVFWVRRAGLILVVGSVIELVAQLAVAGAGWDQVGSLTQIVETLNSTLGAAIALRIFGGLLLSSGSALVTDAVEDGADPLVAVRELVGAGVGSGASTMAVAGSAEGSFSGHAEDHVWQAPSSGPAFAGTAAILASFLFDGHTVSEGPRALHAIINVVHVAAGAVWAGGLLMMALVIWRRFRQKSPVATVSLALRFSVVAAVAVVTAGVAGSVLAILVLDSVSELWTTPWGRILLAKVALVCVAGGAGAYNHFVLIPQLDGGIHRGGPEGRFRSVVTFEAAVIAAVILATAFLIGAAS